MDVAIEIGRRLGLRVELDFTPADDMLAGRGDWDIALPSSAVEPGTFATTSPLLRLAGPAHRPRGIHGSRTRRLVGIDDLRRQRKRRRGLARWWFHGMSVTPVAVPPAPSDVHRLATDDACAADVTAGASAALVTAAWSDADLAARPALKRVGGPVFTESRPVIAVRGERDPAGLVAEIDRIFADMRGDRALAAFSRSRFGGLDLSQPTRP